MTDRVEAEHQTGNTEDNRKTSHTHPYSAEEDRTKHRCQFGPCQLFRKRKRLASWAINLSQIQSSLKNTPFTRVVNILIPHCDTE